jgi:hypothetical protein
MQITHPLVIYILESVKEVVPDLYSPLLVDIIKNCL